MVVKRIVNVLGCGADPSGKTDCTQAFRDALARAGDAGVLVPAGIYRISGLISGEVEPSDDVAAVVRGTRDTSPEEE